MKAVVFPKSGLITEQGTLLQWTASEGDRVEEGQLLCEVETEKTTIEVTAPVSGLLRKILVAEGGKGPVGMTLGWVGEADEEIPEVKEVPTLPDADPQRAAPAARPKVRPQRAAAGGRLRASPAARKLAADNGIELAEISGSGPGGAITTGDVERAIEVVAADADVERVPMSSMRRAIANQTQESFQQAPHFYLSLEADAELLSEDRPEGVSITHCLIKAAGLALREFPQMRAKLQGQEFLIPHAVHIGLITAVEGGLVVPVVRDADQPHSPRLPTRCARSSRTRVRASLPATMHQAPGLALPTWACTMWRPFMPSFTRPNPPSSPSVRSWKNQWSRMEAWFPENGWRSRCRAIIAWSMASSPRSFWGISRGFWRMDRNWG